MASLIYNNALNKSLTGGINFGSDTFKVMLVTSAYVPNKDTHNYRNDVTNEITGTGYVANGATVTVSVNSDVANDRQDISLGQASWTNATITAAGAVYYKSRGGASSADEIIAYIDFGGNVSSTAGTFTLTTSTIRIQN